MKRMPALFLSHGSPMLALENENTDQYVRTLKDLSRGLPKPKAILSIGAHFYGPFKKIDVSIMPETIYDFGGFPDELYEIKYRANGYPQGEKLFKELLPGLNYEPIQRGFDHGTWTVLRHLYPDEDIPIFSISIDSRDSLEDQFELGEKLRILRENGIMLIGNGNIIHDFKTVDWSMEKNIPHGFAADFDKEFKQNLMKKDYDKLTRPYDMKGGRESFYTPEHYIPALIIIGASFPDEEAKDIYEGFELGSMGRRAFGFGL